ncbi:alpha/beta-type small acid-soluble spore protein [Sedimentibacter hydroxybenzoicus DSM 7310]|uniref:Alpha/beta-type small acid-soluble spore protein n=1 Tax=Sedimentibacter hydroxybenzoicus DSM 7310 TaxID=1123245 RepID=A0A974BGX1_SEDHY|nr:alpha/beta-type small acid-soluble spore protein [Sedimentibacter hydroxybenzoicus]NYB72933.1 alpha/beta-type small acid-soluble spore protein [Sedimentibacter hydroxybenzoicus DSM 7310]
MSENKKRVIPSKEAKIALDQMKAEYARELAIANPQAENRGNLTSRQNGYVGGYINKDKQKNNKIDRIILE